MPEPDLRNLRPPVSEWRYWVCWGLAVVAGSTVIAVSLPELRGLGVGDASLLVIVALLIMLELGPLFRGRWERPLGVDLAPSIMLIYALLLHWGLAVAIIGQTVAMITEACLVRRAPWRAAVNIAQYAVMLGAAHLALVAFGQQASPAALGDIGASTLPALLAAAVVGFAVNSLVVGTIDAVHYGLPWWSEVTLGIGLVALNDGAAIALAPLVVLAAERSPWLVPLMLIPLYAVYRSNVASLALKHRAGHDTLTGLPNRAFLLDRAHEVFVGMSGSGRPVVGLFVLDLDRFKEVNDTLGHHAGDRLLMVVAERLSGAVRPGDLVARLGGDEFAVLLPDLADEATARVVAGRISTALKAPLHLDGVLLNVDSSLGIALAPAHGGDFDTLLQHADLAMYSAKGRGTSVEVYTAGLTGGSANRLNLLADLRRALEDQPAGELALHYQPQISLAGDGLVGVEALLRWTHPDRGPVGPDTYISKVEPTAVMAILTHWVIDTALAQTARWAAAGMTVRVAVNVSVTDLHREDFAGQVAAALHHHQVDPRRLRLEITEGALMVDPGRVLTTLHALQRLGVSLSLDDFGTGYSSLSQLHRLPVAEIKIDRTFISRMQSDPDDATIVASMIELGRALGLRVVAEGVENQATLTQLATLGCHDAQGRHISPALPEPAVTTWLHNHPITLLSRTATA